MGDDPDSQDEKGEPAATSRSDWKQLASTGTLLAAVLVILVAGAALRAEKSAPWTPPVTRPASPGAGSGSAPSPPSSGAEQIRRPPAAATTPARPVPAPSPAVAAPAAPRPLPSPAGSDLERRAAQDLERIASAGASFTAQVAVTCKPENTRRILQKASGMSRLYILSMPEKGDNCYRLCWGVYPSAKEAAKAPDLPAFLRDAGGGRPAAKSVAEIVR